MSTVSVKRKGRLKFQTTLERRLKKSVGRRRSGAGTPLRQPSR
nr:MAG TPA: hypothetical protein [Caudoviricetes sp.]